MFHFDLKAKSFADYLDVMEVKLPIACLLCCGHIQDLQ